MDNRFSPYQGAKSFLFISYGRGDIEVVLRVIAELRNQNYRIWYDEGIPVGTDWPMYISRRANASSAILFFLSGKSMVSPNCYSEIVSAAQSGKRIICVLIDSSAQLLYGALLRDGKLSVFEAAYTAYLNHARNSLFPSIPVMGESATPIHSRCNSLQTKS